MISRTFPENAPPSRPNFYDNALLPLENVTRAVSFSKITRKKICLFFDPNHYAISIHVQKIDMRRWKFDPFDKNWNCVHQKYLEKPAKVKKKYISMVSLFFFRRTFWKFINFCSHIRNKKNYSLTQIAYQLRKHTLVFSQEYIENSEKNVKT